MLNTEHYTRVDTVNIDRLIEIMVTFSHSIKTVVRVGWPPGRILKVGRKQIPATCRAACRRGFTLVEVILAFVVLSVSIIGGSALLSLNHRSLIQAQARRMATWAAVYRLEEMKTVSHADLPDRHGEIENISLGNIIPARRETAVQPLPGQPGVLHLTVTVDWDRAGNPGVVVLDTLVSE